MTGELDLRFVRLTDALSSEALETFMLRSCLVTPLLGPPEVAFRRLMSFLVRRGYSASLAREAATRALAVTPGDEGT